MVETNITLETFENIVISLLKEKGYDTEIVTWSGTRGPEHRLVRKKVKKAGSKLRVTASVKIEFIYNHYMEMLSKGSNDIVKPEEILANHGYVYNHGKVSAYV